MCTFFVTVLVPGLPSAPFILLSIIAGVLALVFRKHGKRVKSVEICVDPKDEDGLLTKSFKTFLIILSSLAVVVCVILIPSFMIDILQTLNIVAAFIVFFVSLGTLVFGGTKWIKTIAKAVVIIIPLCAVSNIATIRSMVTTGYAGEVTLAFGNYIVGGNLIVGVLAFLIQTIFVVVIVLITWLVAKRVEECSLLNHARLSLKSIIIYVCICYVLGMFGLVVGVMVGTYNRGMSFGDAIRVYLLQTIGNEFAQLAVLTWLSFSLLCLIVKLK